MLQRFTESFSYDLESIKKIPMTESSTLLEDSNGASYKYIAAYRVPVSRFDYKNANGRVYTKKLWENVKNKQKEIWEGSIGLADHPGDDEDASVKNAYCVWKNLDLNETTKLVEADLYLVGHYGKIANEILEAGGKVGFSSSGFGELAEDASTVREDTYMLERVSDWVLNPSQGVYGTVDMRINKDMKIKKESIVESNTVENVDAKEQTIMKESVSSSGTKMAKSEIRKFREDVVAWTKQAESVTDLQEKLDELTEILSYFSEEVAPDLKEAVEKQIRDTKEQIKLAVKEHTRIKEDFGVETAEQLKEGVKNLAVDTTLYERDSEEWKLIAKGLQEKLQKVQAVLATLPTVEAYKNSLAYSKKIKEDATVAMDSLKNTISGLKANLSKKEMVEKTMIKELNAITSKLNEATELNAKYKKYTESLKMTISSYKEEKLAEANEVKAMQENADRIQFTPKKGAASFDGYNESARVVEYYDDLVARHGKEMAKYEETIKSCKTLQEAMKIYTKIITTIDESKTRKIPEALDMEDRKRLIESKTGITIAKNSKLSSRIPPTWL